MNIDHTLGILTTKCPVVLDRSATESVVFTSSGNANCKTYESNKKFDENFFSQNPTFPLIITRI